MIKEAIAKVVGREDLTEKEMETAMEEVMSGGATPAQIGSFITALRMKGETLEEITGAAKVMRAKAQSICPVLPENGSGSKEVIVDIVGTGGDGTRTFNVSTTAAFVVAGAGLKVAKHGNRAVSSLCGSADVLEHLGVSLDLSPEDVGRCVREIGIGFLFAPLFHKAMKYAAAPRQEIGLRTIFNMLGPLTNPAGANVMVIGVYDSGLTEIMAGVLQRLGARQAFVVCGEGTFDEISICSATKVSRLEGDKIRTYMIEPEAFGLKRARVEDIRGGDGDENARIVRMILEGGKGPKRDMVLFNGAAAFVAAGLDSDLRQGMARAAKIIDSGKAMEKLDALVRFSRACVTGRD
jgi:anthranilate phosphoribosyltransferase